MYFKKYLNLLNLKHLNFLTAMETPKIVYLLTENCAKTLRTNQQQVFAHRLLNFVYLHGQLETEVKHDLVFIYDSSIENLKMNTINQVVIQHKTNEGVNIDYFAFLFYWEDQDKQKHGLISFASDQENFQYALEKYCERAENI